MRKDTCPALQRPLCPRRHRWCRLPGGWARTPLDCTSNWVRQRNCINPTATKFPHLIWSLVPDTAFKNQMVSFSKPGPVCSRLHVPMCDVSGSAPPGLNPRADIPTWALPTPGGRAPCRAAPRGNCSPRHRSRSAPLAGAIRVLHALQFSSHFGNLRSPKWSPQKLWVYAAKRSHITSLAKPITEKSQL